MDAEPELNPAQRQVLDLLGASDGERPSFDAGLGAELRLELERALAPVAAELGSDDQIFVSKYALSQVHGCEARYLAENERAFTWSVPVARGSVTHKAIELAVSWRGEAVPVELVDESMARLGQGNDGLADWLRTCGEGDRAELRGEATDRVSTFLECFPPLKPQWRPVTESRVRVELFDAKVILSGRIDLSLGAARGTTAGKVLIDLKTGGFAPAHLDDLRFYALLETIRLGTPPRLVASYYLDAGRAHPETVTEALLESTVARTADGVTRIAALAAGAVTGSEPAGGPVTKRTGPACRWCPILTECDEGRASLADAAETGDW